MDIGAHLHAIWVRRWWLLVLALLVALPVFFVRSMVQPVYQASTTLQVRVDGADLSNSQVQQNIGFLEQTYAQLVSAPDVVKGAAARAGLAPGLDQLVRDVSVRPTTSPGFLIVETRGARAQDAQRLAKGVGDQLTATVRAQQQTSLERDTAPLEAKLADLRQRLGALSGTSAEAAALETEYDTLVRQLSDRQAQPTASLAEIVAPALPRAPSSPRPARDALLTFLVAFVLLAEASVALGSLGRLAGRLPRDATAELRRFTGLPVFVVGRARGWRRGGETASGFQDLKFGLLFLRRAAGQRVLTVIGVGDQSRSSDVAVHLARTATELGGRVVIIDADSVEGMVHHVLDLPLSPGLEDVLAERIVLSEALRTAPAPDSGVFVLTAGTESDRAEEVLARSPLSTVLEQLSPADLVIVHAASTARYVDALATATQCGTAVVLAVDPRTVGRDDVRAALDGLQLVGATPLAVVVNRLRSADLYLADGTDHAPSPLPPSAPACPDVIPGQPGPRQSTALAGLASP